MSTEQELALEAGAGTARPADAGLRMRLLRQYVERGRAADARRHVLELEALGVFRDEPGW